MTTGQTSLIPFADPHQVAKKTIKGLNKNKWCDYLPHWWFIIMLVYRWVPSIIFNRMGKSKKTHSQALIEQMDTQNNLSVR